VIDAKRMTDSLLELLSIPSPCGFTDEVVHYLSGQLSRIGVEFQLTRRGTIRARLPGADPGPARALVTHVDTVGAMVRLVRDDGRMMVAPIGHWSSRFAEGARVTIFSETRAHRGCLLPCVEWGVSRDHGVEAVPLDWDHVELRLEDAVFSAEDVAKLGIEVGDIIAIDPQPEFLDNGFIVSRHLDNKAGVAVMLAALKAMQEMKSVTPVDIHWLFTIAEEVGVGASSILTPDVVSIVAVDNGTTAPGQNSDEFGVTVCMADQTGPFDYHLTKKLVQLCRANEIRYQKDVFRHYRSDSASAVEAGADVRTALITFGVDASHGYERIHMHALRSLAELVTAYAVSPVAIKRDLEEIGDVAGFTRQPTSEADQRLSPDDAGKLLKTNGRDG